MFASNPHLNKPVKETSGTAVVEPEALMIDGNLHLVFTPEQIGKAKSFTDKTGKESASAGFRMDTTVAVEGEGRYRFSCKWLGITKIG